jgi:hypothetical protein
MCQYQRRPPSAEEKTGLSSRAVFFSYWSSVFSNTDAKAIRCLKNKFHNPFKMEF